MKLFDSHAHYYDERFFAESVDSAKNILASVFDGDVGYIVNVGTNNENNPVCLSMAQEYEGMYAAVGLHPADMNECDMEELAKFEQFLIEHRDFKMEKIVAIGEIGFDYYHEPCDKEKQKAFFDGQMELAEKYGLPVVIHDREAHGDSFDMVLKHKNVTGVFHSYSGSAEMAAELVKRGWYISFSGVVTFKNANRVREVARTVPLDRLLIETDCPYLAPHPMRGKMNHSGYLHYTAQTIADVFGVEYERIVEITANNAKKLFGINQNI